MGGEGGGGEEEGGFEGDAGGGGGGEEEQEGGEEGVLWGLVLREKRGEGRGVLGWGVRGERMRMGFFFWNGDGGVGCEWRRGNEE